MKFVPEQNFIQHVSTQKYEFSMLDWFGGVFHPTFHPIILNVFSNFGFRFNHKHLLWMRKAQDLVLQLYYKTMYYYYTRPRIKFLTIFPLPIYNSFVHEIVFEIVSNCFSGNRWIVPTSWNLKWIE